MRIRHAVLAISVFITACSHTPTALESFHAMDPEWQQAYIAFYPELNSEQRKEMLEGSKHPYALLAQWGKKTSWFRKEEDANGLMRIRWDAPASAYTLRSLEIRTDRGAPIVHGMGFNAKAILKYADGREADATADVRWSVSPSPRVKIHKGRVEFGCLHEEISVTAEFLAERKHTLHIPVLKPLKAFDITLEDAAQSFRGDGYLELSALATCEDGSRERVTCQADWSTTREIGEVVGCGQFRLYKAENELLNSESVRAHYGDRDARIRLRAPASLPGGRKTAPTVSR